MIDNPPTKAEHREWSRRRLQQLRAQFVATRNPLFAWDAYAESRLSRFPIPAWVHDYLDDAWRNLMHLRQSPPEGKEIARQISKALGFVPGGVTIASWENMFEESPFQRKKIGAYNPFSEKSTREFGLAFHVYDALVDGSQLLYAYQHAAQHYGVSQRQAELAWKKYEPQFPALPRARRK